MQDEINLVWDHILPAMHDGPLPEDSETLGMLENRLLSLALPVPADRPDSPMAVQITGKRFLPWNDPESKGSFSAVFSGDSCLMALNMTGEEKLIPFGRGRWLISETDLEGPNLIRRPGGPEKNLIAAAYEWNNDSTLDMIIRYIESPHHIRIKCSFEGDTLILNARLSPPPGYDMPALKAVMEK
jgi:hypothetical protein